MYSPKRLSQAGFAHHFILVLVVIGIAMGGTYYVVMSKAATTAEDTNDSSIDAAETNDYDDIPVQNNELFTLAPQTDSERRVASTPRQKRITIVGDSITARHKNVKKYGKGWWSYLGDASNAKITLSAQGGSGYVRKGKNCKGTTFGDRIAEIGRSNPTAIIIEGGRNDAMICKGKNLRPASKAEIQAAVSSYMERMVTEANKAGVSRKKVFVFVPWGTEARAKRAIVEPIIRSNAERVGFQYIAVPPYGKNLTKDGTHPNPAGSRYIFNQLQNAGILHSLNKAYADDDDTGSASYDFDYEEGNGDGLDSNLNDTDNHPKDKGSSSAPKPKRARTAASAESVVMATYNILHAEDHPGRSSDIGDCGGISRCVDIRSDRQVQIITGKANNAAFDIFGTQETAPSQYRALKNKLKGYDVFPSNTSRMNNRDDGATAIWWDSSRFSLVDSGKTAGISNTNKSVTVPWVELRSRSTGRILFVTNVHYAIHKLGGTPENIRRSSRLTIDWVKQHVSDDAAVFVLGDFNDQLPQRLSYCVYTADGVMQHAMDMSNDRNPDRECPTNKKAGIDHIYATPISGLSASKWRPLPKTGIYGKASDHAPVLARFRLAY